MAAGFSGFKKTGNLWAWVSVSLWVLVMIGMPMTSFPALTRLTGATVAPFSVIPLAILILVWFIPHLIQRGSLPRETVPYIVFTLFVIALAAYAFFLNADIFRNRPLFSQELRTFASFGIGLAFFLVSSAWNRQGTTLRRTLQFINIGGALMLAWSIIQAVVYFKMGGIYPPSIDFIKVALVTQADISRTGRLAGLTWEASWFAHQLNMLYLPLWLSASYQRTSVFPKLWKISIENIFLVLGLGAFFLTSPRIGGLALMLMLLFLFLKFNLAVYRWIIRRLNHMWNTLKHPWLAKAGIGLLVICGFLAVYGLFSAAVVKVASERDWRVKAMVNSADRLLTIKTLDENTLFGISQNFAFLERSVYWMTGWHIFNDYPILGVGLGNSGYYFVSHLPSIGWASIEVRTVVYRDPGLPNIKSIWYRLLAETGIIGFSIFVTWLLVLWVSASATGRIQDDILRTVALAGQLAILAFVFEGFSIDSFGLPYLFLMMGLTASAGSIGRQRLLRQTN